MGNRFNVLSIASFALLASGCSDATGALIGGEPLYNSSASIIGDGAVAVDSAAAGGCPSDGGTPTWPALYSCYFNTCGTVGCHNAAADYGANLSGFVCGATVDSCFMGITHTVLTMYPTLVPAAGATDGTTTALWSALNKGGLVGAAKNNMPLGAAAYTAADLVSIRSWIESGAKQN